MRRDKEKGSTKRDSIREERPHHRTVTLKFPISFWAQCSNGVCRLHRLRRPRRRSALDRGVALTSLSVRQLMSYSPCKKEYERKRRVKGKERTKRRTERTAEVNRSRLLIGTSQLPVASRLAYAHLVCSLSSLVSPSCSLAPRSLAGNTFFFRYFRASFSLYFCRFPLWHSPKCIRSVGSAGDKGAINGFYSVSNWKSIGCRRCHKMFREIGMYRWSIRVRFDSFTEAREPIIAETR